MADIGLLNSITSKIIQAHIKVHGRDIVIFNVTWENLSVTRNNVINNHESPTEEPTNP